MDKNGWMSPVVPIMGFERTEKARVLSNRDRQNRINSLKVKPAYENPAAKKPEVSPEYSNTISVVMTEKLWLPRYGPSLIVSVAASPGDIKVRSIVEFFPVEG